MAQVCRMCHRALPADAFGVTARGIRTICKACQSYRNRLYKYGEMATCPGCGRQTARPSGFCAACEKDELEQRRLLRMDMVV